MIIRLLIAFSILLACFSTLHAAEPVSIGVVLPLSGKFATFGNKALQGIELAIERYNEAGKGKKNPVKLLIKDSQGLPEAAEKAVIELDKEGVSVIIGPILGVTAETAAKKAQELGIPLITMTQKEGITEIGEWVFRNCITNTAQVAGLVEHVATEGIKRAAVLYPDNPYGRELARLFTQALTKKGGKVVASKDYKDGQTDFGTEIKALLKPEPSKKQKGGETKSRFPFDAIFIPDYAERVGLILPQLAFYDVKGVKLLGLSGWNSPKLIEMAGDFLYNVMFVDGFFPGSRSPHVKDFVSAYAKTFGEEPGILEAQAYDSTGMALSIISKETLRDGIRDGISRIKDYQGVSGEITFKGRDAGRGLYHLTVNKGAIEEISEP